MSEILDAGVALYRARFGALIGVTVAVVAPVAVLGAVVALSAQADPAEVGFPTTQTEDDFGVQIAALLVTTVLTTVAAGFVTAAATRIVGNAYVGGDETTRAAVTHVGRRIAAIVGLTIVSALGIFVGLLLCVVPGILVQTAWCVAVPALLIEGRGITDALQRSYSLTRAAFGLSFGVYWLNQLLQAALTGGLGALLGFVIDPTSDSGDIALSVIAQALTLVVTTPLVATALVALYFDLRIRSEGFDVQVMLGRIDARAAGTPITS